MKRTTYSFVWGILFFVATLYGCGGGGGADGGGGSTGKLALSATDAPASDVLSLEITVDSAVLTRSDGTTTALLDAPDRMEIVSLMGFVKPMSVKDIPNGDYTKITLNLSSPELVLRDPLAPAAPIAVPVTLSASSVELDINLTVASGSSTHLLLDFDVASSVANIAATTNPQSLTPVFKAPLAVAGKEEIDGMAGVVVAVQSDRFTFRPFDSQATLEISVNAETEFEDFMDQGRPEAFSSLQVNDQIEIEGYLLGATLVATEIELMDEDEDSLEGVILAIDSGSFTLLVRDGPSACIGKAATVAVNTGTLFEPDQDAPPPTGFQFTAFADLGVGQKVDVDVAHIEGGTTLNCEAPSVVAAEIELEVGAMEATVTNIDTVIPSFTVNGAGLLDGKSIVVRVDGETELKDIALGPDMINLPVRIKGLLFYDRFGNMLIVAEEGKQA